MNYRKIDGGTIDNSIDGGTVLDLAPREKVNPGTIVDFGFDISFKQYLRLLHSVELDVFLQDKKFLEKTAAYHVTDYQVIVNITSNDIPEQISYSSSDESIAVVSSKGFIRFVSEGFVTITASSNSYSVERGLEMRQKLVTPSSSVFVSPVLGSARKNTTGAIDNKISSTDPSVTKAVFTNQDHVTPFYVRNANVWIGLNIDLTCCSPWNSRGGVQRAGTLVGSRSFVFANHFDLQSGDTIRFVNASNQHFDYTISSVVNINQDLSVGFFASAVDSSLGIAKVLPFYWVEHFPTNIEDIPVAYLDQEEKILVADGVSISGNTASIKAPTNSTRLSFYEDIVSGDSGNPVFLIINNEPVIITTFLSNFSGTAIEGNNLINLDLTMTANASELTSKINLTEFTSFL